MAGQVLLESATQDGLTIAVVTLCHEGRLNAMSRAMWRELKAVFDTIQASQTWRAVVLRGQGGAFCAGGDISEYPSFRFSQDSLRAFHEVEVWGGLKAVLDCDVPVVAQIEGACMGAGVELACCCDIRVAGQSAKFGAPIARLGFPMAPREAQLVASVAGQATAREMLLEAAVLDAAELKSRGFVQRLTADDQVAAQAFASAYRIAALAPQAARLNKQNLRQIQAIMWSERQSSIASAATENVASPYAYADSAEHREGVTAFLEKRRPSF